MKKIFGYIFSGLGILGLIIYSIPEFKTSLQIPDTVSDLLILIISLVLVATGLFFIMKKGSSKQDKEVPIYKGKQIVGYRRH